MSAVIKPEIRAVLAHRTASSSCCGAPLGISGTTWICSACGEPCDRVLSDPVEVEARG